jgi:hypothetical protein
VNALGIVTMAQITAWLDRRVGPRRMMIGLIGAATGGIILLDVVRLNVG